MIPLVTQPDLSSRVAVIIADGELGEPGQLETYLDAHSFVIAVDGGARHAETLRLRVDLLLGDFDSLSPDLLSKHERQQTPIVRHPVEKDKTDTHLALEWATAHGATNLLLLAATGNRLDQTLAHLLILPRLFEERGVRSRVVTPTNEIFPVVGGHEVTFSGRKGMTFSLVPTSEVVRGVTLEGAKYLLQDSRLTLGASLSVSNEFMDGPVTLSVAEGRLLVVLVRSE